jgi:hypothetical protein
LYLYNGPLVSDPPSVEASGPSHTLEGSTVTMGCHMTDGYPRELTHVQWLKDGARVDGATVGSPNITLRDVTVGDSGLYACVVSNGAGDAASNAIHLEVYGMWYIRATAQSRSPRSAWT